MFQVMLTILALSNVYLFIQIYKEKKRSRVIQAFISGIIESLQKCIYAMETFDKEKASIDKDYYKQCYNEILRSINASVEADFWERPFKKWLTKDRQLFLDTKYANEGFNTKYLDLFDMAISEKKME